MSATTGTGAMRRERAGGVLLRAARVPVLAVALLALGGCATGPRAARVPFLVETPATNDAARVRFAWPASVDLTRAHLLRCAYEPTTRDAFCVLFDEAVQRQPPSGSGTF